jgi:hypothetical protein
MKAMRRLVEALAAKRGDPEQLFIRVIKVCRDGVGFEDQERWMALAEDAVLADLGPHVGVPIIMSLEVREDRLVLVEAARWRYLGAIDEDDSKPVITIVERDERRW